MAPFVQYGDHIYILLVADYVPKWVEAISCTKNDAITITKLLTKYTITHKIANAYHPQTNGQAKVSNRETKNILEKVVNSSHKNWASNLNLTIWAYRTAYKIPIGMTTYALVLEKACHLPLEFEHKVMWACKKLNLNHNAAEEARLLQLHELQERSFVVKEILTHGAMEIASLNGDNMFKVNGQRLKVYYEDENCIKISVDLK
ncbi:KRAB-A domain-containing protein 2-like [Cucumis melo var. makuwa]|uniref:KRAB-A domain-containing protein 2-like n=1 Tax=Cucumis melo var. makuwa TaxID=1194695 RepID=A0A5D3DV18_CUCMM|nr:KRAB-A domain-containing protein 2-like [Cucumis melo var. makuwa]TYK27551.1 KRAB-A domain-containing protein 2-like [Cucumis melo var. makuwa]